MRKQVEHGRCQEVNWRIPCCAAAVFEELFLLIQDIGCGEQASVKIVLSKDQLSVLMCDDISINIINNFHHNQQRSTTKLYSNDRLCWSCLNFMFVLNERNAENS